MKATLYVEVEGRIIPSATVTLENIIPAFEVRGFTMTRINDNPRQRAELQGWPMTSFSVRRCDGKNPAALQIGIELRQEHEKRWTTAHGYLNLPVELIADFLKSFEITPCGSAKGE